MPQQAHPFVGTWKLHPHKSKLEPSELVMGAAAHEEQTMVIAERGGELEVRIAVRGHHRGPASAHYVIPAAGGEGRVIESQFSSVSGEQISDRVRESTFYSDGNPIVTIRSEVSADGKTLTATVQGNDPESGQSVSGSAIYEKQ